MKLNPNYISGLVDGEGCFCIVISRHKTKKLGFDARLTFEIEMIIEDKPLLERLKETLNCGRIYTLNYTRYGWRPHTKFAIHRFEDIKRIVVPFFKKYQLQSKKKKDFDYFCQAVKIFENKEHLSSEGIKRLKEIQSKMNLRRKLKYSSARVRENRVPSGEKNIVE